MSTKTRVSNNNCCVVGCGNSYSKTDGTVKFYSFPSRPHDKIRREKWIQCVGREEFEGGSPWQPRKWSRICSQHFIGNEKSNHPHNPSYLPSIFPAVYKKRQIYPSLETSLQKKARFVRASNRQSNELMVSRFDNKENDLGEIVRRCRDFSCQVNSSAADELDESFIFDCMHNSDGVAVQANIGRRRSNMFKSLSNKIVGPEGISGAGLSWRGFHGYQSIKDEDQLIDITGVTRDNFNLFLSLLTIEHGNDKLSVEDKLLIFLMKIKLGVSYCALGVLFDVHRITISTIFLAILSVLVDKTKDYVFWPSRQAVMDTMPEAFKLNYPNCRAIIKCSELRIQQPNSVDQRLFTYSHHKGTFTAKFLIGLCPNGFVSFISKCYGGRSSDAFITSDSGFLNLLQTEDVVLADKGFPGIKLNNNAIITMPPFVNDGKLTAEEVQETYGVASVRRHVERSIHIVKSHDILHKINHDLMPHIDDIVRMCCVLTNLKVPIIRQ